jgi:hypothetical protein
LTALFALAWRFEPTMVVVLLVLMLMLLGLLILGSSTTIHMLANDKKSAQLHFNPKRPHIITKGITT